MPFVSLTKYGSPQKEIFESYREVHAVAPILSTKEPEYSHSMGYEYPNTTPETKSDEIIKSGVEELVSILSENEVTLEDKMECDMLVCENSPVCDNHSEIFFDSNNDDDISSDDDDFEDIEYVEASLPDPNIASVEEENVVYQEEEEVDLEDVFQIQDVVLREKLLSINRLIANIESLNDNLTPDRVLNSSVSIPIFEESKNSLSDNFSPEFETFCDHTEETRSGNTTTHADNSFPEYDSFCFEIEPDQERLINIVKNDISDDSSNDPLLEEADLFLASDNSIPSDVEYDFELDAGDEIECIDAKDEFDVSNDEDDGYYSFMFLINSKVFSFLLSAESEDTIFDPVAPILSTKEPEYSPSMGYKNPNTTPKIESDEIIKSGVEELVPILSENEEDVDLEDVFQIQDIVLREKLLSITCLIANIESLNDNSTPDRVLNSSISVPISEEYDNSLLDNFSPEFETFCDHTEETRSGNTTTHADDSIPEYDSFCFEIEPDQERLINLVKNDISDDSSNGPLLKEADLFLASDLNYGGP
nr:hypothetical protein [Tanacetum cinerariifolium]